MSNINQLHGPMHERVVGFEMEYSASLREGLIDRDVTQFNAGNAWQALGLHEKIKEGRSHCDDGFLDDGFMVYKDGVLTEVCTPETHPDQVGVLQIISEEMVIDALESMTDSLNRDGRRVDYLLPLRVSSDRRTSGFHENYQVLVEESDYNRRLLRFLNIYAATLGIWTGQGLVHGNGDYGIAQKAGLACSGSENHVDIKGQSTNPRYEFRRDNYPTSHWQLKYRASYTSAVIRAAELGMLSEFETEDPDWQHYIAEQVSDDPHKIIVGDKTAIQWQYAIAEKVSALARKHSFPDYESVAAEEVAGAIANLNEGSLVSVALFIPWVIKKLKIERALPGYISKIDKTDEEIYKAQQICVSLDSRGTGSALEMIREKKPIYSARDVQQARKHKTHRLPVAVARGNAIKEASSILHSGFVGSWMSTSLRPCEK